MQMKNLYMNIRLVLGLISLASGLFAANLALFDWIEQAGLYYLLGEYARYVCAYGGFGAMIFGAMLVNDYLLLKKRVRKKHSRSPETACDVERKQEEIIFEQKTSGS